VIASIFDSTAAASLRANLTASSARLDRGRSRKRPNAVIPMPITNTSRKERFSLIFSIAESSNYRTILYDIEDHGASSAIRNTMHRLSKHRLLLVNDDGIDAPGIVLLEKIVRRYTDESGSRSG